MKIRSGRGLVRIMWVLWTGVCAGVLTLAGAYLYLSPQLPSAETYRHVRLETPLRVFAAGGELIAEFGERRVIPVRLEEVPPRFIRAILDTEDKRFYEHGGVDLITLLNSAVALAANMGEITRGGSTITMQLPRNLGTFSKDQVFIRKFKEILLALKIERELTKDQILELYINAVPFGKRAYGAQAAAYTYYGRPLAELGLAELTMLAGIPQAPTAGNPINGPERAMRRRNVVLTRMLEQGSISPADYEAAVAAPNTARLHERTLDVSAAYAAEWVRQILLARLGREVYVGGYEATTTIDARLQAAANVAVREGLLRYDRRHGYRGPAGRLETSAEADTNELVAALGAYPLYPGMEPAVVVGVAETSFAALRGSGEIVGVPLDLMRWARRYIDVNTRGPAVARPADVVAVGDVVYLRPVPEGLALAQPPAIQGALVAIEPATGAVKALVGGYDFATNQFNHAMQGGRQPGSGFKPFVYSAALEYGVTPASIFMDAPLVFEDKNLETTYRPRNDRLRYNGPTRLREALYRSINLVSMRVLLAVGANRTLDYVRRFGFDTTTFPRNTQLAIGGGTMAITPLQMATGYAVFANGGYLVTPNILKEVRLADGTPVFEERYPIVCRNCDEAAPGAPPISVAAADFDDEASLAAPRVIDERNAFIVTSMLQDVVRRGTGRRALELERSDLAGKTGTTNEADNWFNGYQQNLVATAWMGFSDHTPLGDNEYGSTGPLPIWVDFMRVALEGVPESSWPQPPGVVTMKIDPRSGEPAAPEQGNAIFEYFLAEHTPVYRPPATSTDPLSDSPPVRSVDIF
jgi:penicillin-binding protein 1A